MFPPNEFEFLKKDPFIKGLTESSPFNSKRANEILLLKSKYGNGSRFRFHHRIWIRRKNKNKLPYLTNYFWWLIHNIIAHLAIAVFPMFKWSFDFHDWTSKKLNPVDQGFN